jgi:hypothetical protein
VNSTRDYVSSLLDGLRRGYFDGICHVEIAKAIIDVIVPCTILDWPKEEGTVLYTGSLTPHARVAFLHVAFIFIDRHQHNRGRFDPPVYTHRMC